MIARALPFALVAAAGCGGDDEPADREPASRVLGAYTQVLRVGDLPAEADRAMAGRYRLFLKRASFESFTPKGPGYAGEGGPEGTHRYVFAADYGRECGRPATYAVQPRGGRVAFEAVGADPCPLRREVLTSATWKPVSEP